MAVTKFVMPSLANPGREYLHFHYSALGDSYGEALLYALGHPIETFKLFFINHSGSRFGPGIKSELYITLLISGAWVWFLKPRWLLMAIPVIAQKVLHNDIGKWGINYHYNVELAALLTFALFDFFSSKEKFRFGGSLVILVVLATLGITSLKYYKRDAKWYDPNRQNIFIKRHYVREFDTKYVRNVLKEHIPKDEKVAVSAHYHLVPQIPFREDIYEFPIVDQAEYIAVILGMGKYPLKSDEEYRDSVDRYIRDPNWVVLHKSDLMVVLRKEEP